MAMASPTGIDEAAAPAGVSDAFSEAPPETPDAPSPSGIEQPMNAALIRHSSAQMAAIVFPRSFIAFASPSSFSAFSGDQLFL